MWNFLIVWSGAAGGQTLYRFTTSAPEAAARARDLAWDLVNADDDPNHYRVLAIRAFFRDYLADRVPWADEGTCLPGEPDSVRTLTGEWAVVVTGYRHYAGQTDWAGKGLA